MVVALADAVVDPDTMMVHAGYAGVADRAVFGAGGLAGRERLVVMRGG